MHRAKWSKCMLMLIWVIPVLLIPAALVTSPTMVNAAEVSQIKLCVNPSGLTRVPGANETCRPSEKLVKWDLSGSQDGSGSQGGALTVIDRLGNTVGPLVQSNAVVLTVGGTRLLLGVKADGPFNFAGALTLFYQASNCPLGGELIQLTGTNNFVLPALYLAGTTGYYGDIGSQLYTGGVASRKSYDATLGQFNNCLNISSTGQFMPAKSVSLPAFALPFSIK